MFFSTWAVRTLPWMLLLVYGWIASHWGLSADADGELIWQAASHLRDTGEYVRSRTSGFPLYELLVASLQGLGLTLEHINGVSTCLAATTLWWVGGWVPDQPRWRMTFLRLMLVLWPVFLISSGEAMETALALMLAVALVRRVLQRPVLGVSHALLALMLVLSRLDAALLVMAIAAVAAWRRDCSPWQACLWLGGTGLASLAAYWTLNDGMGFLSGQMLGLDDPLRRLIRAAAGVVNAFQLTGLVLMGLFIMSLWRQHALNGRLQSSHLGSLALATSCFYLPRFIALPDEIFYLAIPVLLWMAAAIPAVSPRWASALIMLGVLQSSFSLALFERLPGSADRLVFRPALVAGPLWQEYRVRQVYAALRDPHQQQSLSCQVFADCPSLMLSHTGPFLMTSDQSRAIVSQRYAYMFWSPRYAELNVRGAFRHLWICADEVVPSTPGWRVWQPLPGPFLTDAPGQARLSKCDHVAH